jgi:hypothetical protein
MIYLCIFLLIYNVYLNIKVSSLFIFDLPPPPKRTGMVFKPICVNELHFSKVITKVIFTLSHKFPFLDNPNVFILELNTYPHSPESNLPTKSLILLVTKPYSTRYKAGH